MATTPMTTLRDLSLRLLRAVTAVVAAVLLLLGAVTLQNNAAHTDTAVTTLTAATASTANVGHVEPPTVHIDAHDGVGGIFCALLGLVALVITTAITLALASRIGQRQRPLFALSRVLARVRPPRTFERWSAVSLTGLAIARI
ncbi:hypothetical protein ITJ54_02010 [Curtobacterium sp. VKM Ac-2865]|jgi:hypothetical protein|nr:hypothetical protein [Curtobacterium sp. VKM Ac-2865]